MAKPRSTRQERQAALETVVELISVYQQQADSYRRDASARRIGGHDQKLTLELEAAARAADAVAERLLAVRAVVVDSLRFSRKRRRKPQPPSRTD